jgi:hypothetical protein
MDGFSDGRPAGANRDQLASAADAEVLSGESLQRYRTAACRRVLGGRVDRHGAPGDRMHAFGGERAARGGMLLVVHGFRVRACIHSRRFAARCASPSQESASASSLTIRSIAIFRVVPSGSTCIPMCGRACPSPDRADT